ncbi:MAG TPA: helix-turn-helix domain-containing protein, partial [Actinomycetota bacterium]|nr:helix-turn-helix domain-containing protein [Actinomycetota bacterium]
MASPEARAVMWERDGRWVGRIGQAEVAGPSREACLAALRRAAGDAVLTVEVMPALAGVSEAARILGWDRRRVSTYVRRGSFPPPVAELAGGRVWRRADVEAFARTRRRRRP